MQVALGLLMHGPVHVQGCGDCFFAAVCILTAALLEPTVDALIIGMSKQYALCTGCILTASLITAPSMCMHVPIFECVPGTVLSGSDCDGSSQDLNNTIRTPCHGVEHAAYRLFHLRCVMVGTGYTAPIIMAFSAQTVVVPPLAHRLSERNGIRL